MTSTATKRCSRLFWLFFILSIAANGFPIAFYVIKAFAQGEPYEKLTLGLLATVAIVLGALNILFKKRLRSVVWLLILGIYVAIDNILPLLIMIGICTIVDEFILTPLYKKFTTDKNTNKQIDKRLP